MKNRIIAAVLGLILALSFAACSADGPVIHEEATEKSATTVNEQTEADTEDEPEEEPERKPYPEKVYTVGEELPAGKYIVTCTGTDYGMRFIVFSGKTEYEAFLNADQFTNGEYCAAVEKNAWADQYPKEGEDIYVNLQEGNIVLYNLGECEFTKFDPLESQTLYPGVYVVGEDIPAETLNVAYASGYPELDLFTDKDSYLAYHKSDRFTVGEENDAVEQNAASSEYLYEGAGSLLKLEPGMILLVKNGIVTYSVDEGPVING